MAGQHDSSEFIDTDFTAHKATLAAPTREDTDRKVLEAQQKLAELKRAQEELERERAGLEELRRRQTEFSTGRDEMTRQLTRGIGLLEEAEFSARRDAEQMSRTLEDFRDALGKVQAIQDADWNKENFQTELTRALATVEHARMEWNSARLKIPLLAGENQSAKEQKTAAKATALADMSFGQLCKLGVAFTWPVALGALAVVLAILSRK